jgi:hypothetical protein
VGDVRVAERGAVGLWRRRIRRIGASALVQSPSSHDPAADDSAADDSTADDSAAHDPAAHDPAARAPAGRHHAACRTREHRGDGAIGHHDRGELERGHG